MTAKQKGFTLIMQQLGLAGENRFSETGCALPVVA